MNVRTGVFVCLLATLGACAEASDPPTGPDVEIAVGALTTADITGAAYTVTIEFTEDGGAAWQPLYGPETIQTDPGDGGAATFIGPCQAAPDGSSYPNRVTLTMDSYTTGTPPDEETVTTGLPPAQVRVFDCDENRDHRVPFEFAIITSADQGFTDITVDLGTNHCSMKVDCQEALETDTEGNRGFTMVTGFACSSGEADAFLAFYGEVCCDDPNAQGGPVSYCTPYGDVTPDVSGNPGVIKVGRHAGGELVLDKHFHNTTWRFDEEWLSADAARICTLTASGWITPEASGPGEDTYPGGGYPLVTWTAEVSAATIDPHLEDCGDVAVSYGDPVLGDCDPSGSPFGGGSGTVADPYLICAPQHLQNIDDPARPDYLAANFLVVNDLDFAGWSGGEGPGGADFMQIGSGSFSGVLDGGGFTIRNFQDIIPTSVPLGAPSVGIFASFVGATIRNVVLEAPQVGHPAGTGGYAGVLASFVTRGVVEDVTIVGALVDGGDSAISYCGGLFAAHGTQPTHPVATLDIRRVDVDATIQNCVLMGGLLSFISSGNDTTTTIEDTVVTGDIDDTDAVGCAGMIVNVDLNDGAVFVRRSTVDATVRCQSLAGGLIGISQRPPIVFEDVVVRGTVEATSLTPPSGSEQYGVGGLIARAEEGVNVQMLRVGSTAAATGLRAGGLGGVVPDVDVVDSYSVATVGGSGAVGGLFASVGSEASMLRVWAAPVILSGAASPSATYPSGTPSVIDSFYFTAAAVNAADTSNLFGPIADGQETTAALFTNFDFTTVWDMATLADNPHAPANPTMPALR